MGFSREEQKVARTLELSHGGHDYDWLMSQDDYKPLYPGIDAAPVDEWDRKVCVMEFVNFVRHGVVDDKPPCVSAVIRDICIERNDEARDEPVVFAALRKIAPELIHTAPTRISGKTGKTVTDLRNPTYRAAERERKRIRDAFVDRWCNRHGYYDWADEFDTGVLSVRSFNALIRELIAVAKFEPALPEGGAE